MKVGEVYKWAPSGPLKRGINCKACGKQIGSDPELCSTCLQIANSLVKDLDPPDDDTFLKLDLDILQSLGVPKDTHASS